MTRQYEETSHELDSLERKILCIQDFGFVKISQLEIERKVLLRKLTDTRIRMMNLSRDQNSPAKSSPCNLNNATLFSTPTLMKLMSKCDSNNNCDEEFVRKLNFDSVEDPTIARELLEEVIDAVTGGQEEIIDYEDEYFNPMEVEFVHQRPVQEDRPTVPLPHARMFWPKKVKVGSEAGRPVSLGYNSTMHDHNCQFRSVEDEVAEADWDNMMRTEVRESHRNNGVKSRGHLRPNYVSKNYKGNSVNYATNNNNNNSSNSKVWPYYYNNNYTESNNVIKSTDSKAETSECREDCICQRSPVTIVCSGQDCSYSFVGRLAAKCPAHPGDNYLMDHAHPCPDCGGILGKRPFSIVNVSEFLFLPQSSPRRAKAAKRLLLKLMENQSPPRPSKC